MVLFAALAGLASTFIKDLVTGKPAGSTLRGIGSGVVKSVKDVGVSTFKGFKGIFTAPTLTQGIAAAGKFATDVGAASTGLSTVSRGAGKLSVLGGGATDLSKILSGV